MKNLPLTALRAFAAMYDRGGVRSAARSLGVTHSSVSRHLQELEAWLGSPLFERTDGSRALRLSPDGETLGKRALAAFSDLDQAVAAMREARNPNGVMIETTPSIAARWLLPRLYALDAAHRSIEVSVIVDQRPDFPSRTEADFGIRMGSGPWPGLECQPLMDDRLIPVMAPSYWRSLGSPSDFRKMRGLRLLHDRDPQAAWSLWKTARGLASLDVRSGPRFVSSDLVLRAAEQGLGVALARQRLAHEAIANERLVVPFPEEGVDLPQAYWIVQKEDGPRRKAVQMVIEWLMGEAGAFQ